MDPTSTKHMTRTYATIAFIAMTAAAAPRSHAQEGPWSLRDCIERAIGNNTTVRQREVTRQQREVDVSTARNSMLPSLSASASQNWSFGRGLTSENTYTNTNTSTTSFTLATNVPLFTGLRTYHNVRFSKLNLEAATADLEKARDDISVEVAMAYVQVLYDMEIRDVASRQVEIDSMQVVRMRGLLDEGKASGVDVARQEATLAQSRSTLAQAESDLSLAVLDLAQLLELPGPEGFTIVRPDAGEIAVRDAEEASPDEIYQEAVALKPGIRAEEIRLKGSQESVKIAKSALYPTLQFNAGIGSDYYNTTGYDMASFSRQIRDNFSQYLGFSLSVPIFNRLETRNSIRSARLDVESQRLQLEEARKSLYKEIQQAHYNALAARARFESSEEACRSSRAAFELMQAKYEYGKADITEFNESKNTWLEAESDLSRAKFEYLYDTCLIDFYRGKDLDF